MKSQTRLKRLTTQGKTSIPAFSCHATRPQTTHGPEKRRGSSPWVARNLYILSQASPGHSRVVASLSETVLRPFSHCLHVFRSFPLPALLYFYMKYIVTGCSAAKSCLCDPMDCITPGPSVLHYLLAFAHIHEVHASLLFPFEIHFLYS